MLRTQVNLREDQYRLLQIQAQQERESLSEIVRGLIDTALKSQIAENNASILLEMSQKARQSNSKTMSRDYKQILYGQK